MWTTLTPRFLCLLKEYIYFFQEMSTTHPKMSTTRSQFDGQSTPNNPYLPRKQACLSTPLTPLAMAKKLLAIKSNREMDATMSLATRGAAQSDPPPSLSLPTVPCLDSLPGFPHSAMLHCSTIYQGQMLENCSFHAFATSLARPTCPHAGQMAPNLTDFALNLPDFGQI